MSVIPYNELHPIEIVARTKDGESVSLGEINWAYVIPCKHCAKWHMNDYESGKERGTCDEWTHLDGFSHATPEDGFCAWGERRDA